MFLKFKHSSSHTVFKHLYFISFPQRGYVPYPYKINGKTVLIKLSWPNQKYYPIICHKRLTEKYKNLRGQLAYRPRIKPGTFQV
jgi:hypothetical protein